ARSPSVATSRRVVTTTVAPPFATAVASTRSPRIRDTSGGTGAALSRTNFGHRTSTDLRAKGGALPLHRVQARRELPQRSLVGIGVRGEPAQLRHPVGDPPPQGDV